MTEKRRDPPDSEPESRKPPASATRAPRAGRSGRIAALVAGTILVVATVAWLRARRQASATSGELSSASGKLVECVREASGQYGSLAALLAHAFPDDQPLARCNVHLDAARQAHARLSAIRPLADREGVGEVAQWLAALADVKLDAPAGDLASAEPDTLESRVASLARSACRVAIAESSADDVDCTVPSPPGDEPEPPRPRKIIDEKTGFLEHAAFTVDVRPNGRISVLLATADRDSSRVVARVATSADGGAGWNVVALEGEAASAGPPLPPRAAFNATTGELRHFLLAQSQPKRGLTGGTIGRPSEDHRALRFVMDLPELPTGLDAVTVGSPLLELPDGRFALALTPRQPAVPGGGVLVLGEKPALMTVPSGRVVAGLGGPPAQLVLTDASSTGSTTVTTVEVPTPPGPWPKPSSSLVLSVPSDLTPAPEQWCGAPNEKYAPFVARSDGRATLLVFGKERQHVMPFALPPGTEVEPSCGSCPPSLLLRSKAELSLLVPAGSKLVTIPVPTPVLYSRTKPWQTAVAACSARSYAVAFVERQRVYVQTARPGTWRFSHPTLLAEPNEEGEPVDLTLAGLDGRLVAIWRRKDVERERLRIEVLTSDDAGASWH